MNRKQKIVILVCLCLMMLTGLVPPWGEWWEGRGGGIYSRPAGYGFLFMPPEDGDHIAIDILLVEWAVMSIVSVGLVFFFADQ